MIYDLLVLLAAGTVAGCLHKLTRTPKGMLWFFKSIIAPRRHGKMLFINWMVFGLCLRISYSFIMFSLAQLWKGIWQTQIHYSICVLCPRGLLIICFSWVGKFKGNTSQVLHPRMMSVFFFFLPFFMLSLFLMCLMFACAQREIKPWYSRIH